MQRLTNSFDGVQVSDRHVDYILNKSENATPELLAFICKMTQASIANENFTECSKTWLCIKYKSLRILSRGNT